MVTSHFVSAAGNKQFLEQDMWWLWHGFKPVSLLLMECCRGSTEPFRRLQLCDLGPQCQPQPRSQCGEPRCVFVKMSTSLLRRLSGGLTPWLRSGSGLEPYALVAHLQMPFDRIGRHHAEGCHKPWWHKASRSQWTMLWWPWVSLKLSWEIVGALYHLSWSIWTTSSTPGPQPQHARSTPFVGWPDRVTSHGSCTGRLCQLSGFVSERRGKQWWSVRLCWASWRSASKGVTRQAIQPGLPCWGHGWSQLVCCATNTSAEPYLGRFRCQRRVGNSANCALDSTSVSRRPSPVDGVGLVRGWSFGKGSQRSKGVAAAYASTNMGLGGPLLKSIVKPAFVFGIKWKLRSWWHPTVGDGSCPHLGTCCSFRHRLWLPWAIGRINPTRRRPRAWPCTTAVLAMRSPFGWSTMPWQPCPSCRGWNFGRWWSPHSWQRPNPGRSGWCNKLSNGMDIWYGPHPLQLQRWPRGSKKGQPLFDGRLVIAGLFALCLM